MIPETSMPSRCFVNMMYVSFIFFPFSGVVCLCEHFRIRNYVPKINGELQAQILTGCEICIYCRQIVAKNDDKVVK